MKRKTFKLLLLAPLVSLITLASCIRDEIIETPSPTGEATVTFALRVPGNSTPETRMMDEAAENKVYTIEVVAFQGGTYSYRVSAPAIKTTGNLYEATLKLVQGTGYDLVIFANSKDIVLGATLVKGTTTKDATLKLFTKSVTGKWNATTGDSEAFPMSSDPGLAALTGKTIDESTNFSTIDLYRMTARAQVELASGVETKFQLEEIWVYNRNKTGYVTGIHTPATEVNPYASRVTPVTGDDDTKLIYKESEVSATACEREIYLFEVANAASATASNLRPCLVVGGTYKDNGKDIFGYYRVDFHDGTNYLDVLRNHSYNITVTDVTGIGFEDPDDAFAAGPESIVVRIVDWNETGMEHIKFDGQYFLSVSPTEFNLFREEQDLTKGHELTIATDVPLKDNKNWTAKLYEDEEGNIELTGTDKWFDIDLTSDNKIYPAKSTVKLTADENTGAERTGWIHITAGRIVFKIKVTQSNQEEPQKYEIIVTTKNGSGVNIEVSELFFEAAGSTPASQDFRVQWSPSSSLLKATLIPQATSPLIATYDPTLTTSPTMLTWDSNGQTYEVAPSPWTSSGDFAEQSAQVQFELQSPAGLITKTINLRQTTYQLITQPATILMDGTPQTFRVRANFTWRAEFVRATEDDKPETSNRIVKTFGVQYGGNNTDAGDPVTFTCFDYITEYDSDNPQKGEVEIKFYRYEKNDWVEWGTVNHKVTCYAAVPVGESNCYMIKHDVVNPPAPILIPTSQINRAISSSGTELIKLPSNWLPVDCSSLKAAVLWSDVNAFGDAAGAVVKTVVYNGADNVNDGKIVVVPGDGVGNAVIILYADNDGTEGYQGGDSALDKIYWSWHIWKSAYFPYQNDSYPSTTPTRNTDWLDRNLGAMANMPTSLSDNVASHGFHYQWGRKDPHPSSNNAGTDNTVGNHKCFFPTETGISVVFEMKQHSTTNNLANATSRPLTRYYGNTTSYDWYTTSSVTTHESLWGGKSSEGKSVYDPCPEGYRVPKNGVWGSTTLSNASQLTSAGWIGTLGTAPYYYGQNNANYGGYYPAAGYRYSGSQVLYGVGTYGCYWSATLASGTGSYNLDFYSSTVNPSYNASRANGFSVRCRAE